MKNLSNTVYFCQENPRYKIESYQVLVDIHFFKVTLTFYQTNQYLNMLPMDGSELRAC